MSHSIKPPTLSESSQVTQWPTRKWPWPQPQPHLPCPPFSSLYSNHTGLPAMSWAPQAQITPSLFGIHCPFFWIWPLFMILVLPKTSHLHRLLTPPTPGTLKGFYFLPVLTSTRYTRNSTKVGLLAYFLVGVCLPHWNISPQWQGPCQFCPLQGFPRPKQSLACSKCLNEI